MNEEESTIVELKEGRKERKKKRICKQEGKLKKVKRQQGKTKRTEMKFERKEAKEWSKE